MLTARAQVPDRILRLGWLRPPPVDSLVSAAIVALAVIGSAIFAARLVDHLVEGRYLADAEHGPAIVAIQAPAAAAPAAKDGQAIVDRNMFCSECVPPPVGAPPPDAPVDPSAVPFTSLPLELVATHVADGPQASRSSQATIRNTATLAEGGYWIGRMIPGAGALVAIRHESIDFRNLASGRVERVALGGRAPAQREPPRPPPSPLADADSRVRRIDDHTFEIDQGLITEVLGNRVPGGIRVVPSTSGGVADGFRVASIAPGSIYAKLGLARGDIIRAANGFALDSLDTAAAAYGKLRDARNVELDVVRAGKPVTLRYTIR